LVEATVRELHAAGRLESALGVQAVELARQQYHPMNNGSQIAALARQWREVMAEALKGAQQAGDALDELETRRRAKQGRAS
jgi:hypothetical protein